MGSQPITGTVGSSTIAHSLGISIGTLYKLVRDGRIPALRVRRGKKYVYRFHQDQVIDAMQKETTMEGQNQEPIEAQIVIDDDMPKMDANQLIAVAKRAKEMAEAYKTLRSHALDITEPHDWLIHGQKDEEDPEVWLESSGCDKLAHLFHINWGGTQQEKVEEHDSRGDYYAIITIKTFRWLGRQIDVEGIVTSRDKFFSKSGEIPSEDVDVAMIREKSETVCIRRGITKLLALSGLPLSALPKRMQEAVKKRNVSYGGGSKGGSTQSKGDRSKADEVWKAMLIMSGQDQAVAARLLKSITYYKTDDGKEKFLDSLESLRRIGQKWLDTTYGKCKREWEKWQSEGGTPYVMSDFDAEEAMGGDEPKSNGEKSDDNMPF